MQLALTYDKNRDAWSARADGYLFVLARRFEAEACGETRDYMITARLGTHPKGFLIEPVDKSKHLMVHHSGFECSGSMCRTDANVVSIDGDCLYQDALGTERARLQVITPGRVHQIVRVADNVNHNWSRPIFRDEVDEVERLSKCPRWKPNPDASSRIAGWHTAGRVAPTPGRCYVVAGESRAAGLPDVAELAV